jgi:hypothetical protein
MHGNGPVLESKRLACLLKVRRFGLLLFLVVIGFAPAGCASHMDAYPSRTGAPPYPDDPEANGNPAKAWYN